MWYAKIQHENISNYSLGGDMRNIQLVIEYDGSRYDGWQKQTNHSKNNSIQEKIEMVLNKMEGESVEVIGAVKTEYGVHAYNQVANFKTNSTKKVYEIKHYLNQYLPRDIAVVEALEVPERFHSSMNLKSIVYQYKINMAEVPSVFQRKYEYYSFKKLDIQKMKLAAKEFLGIHDFKAYANNRKMKKSTQREIFDLEVNGDPNEIIITIHGDDFWPYMARNIVGTLIEVGANHIQPEEIKNILVSFDREKASKVAEASGLFLLEVKY